MKAKSIVIMMLLALGAIACEYEKIQTPDDAVLPSPMDAYSGEVLSIKKGTNAVLNLTPEFLDEINQSIKAEGLNYRIAKAESYTAAGSDEMGITVVANDRGNKQLEDDFVPGDERRQWSAMGGTQITYAIDQTTDAIPPYGGLIAAETDAAIERGMMTWDNIENTHLGLTRNDDYGLDIGYLAFVYGLGGSPYVFADVQHAGFRDADFSGGVLGVTFTFVFTNDDGSYTDIDNNGKADVAFREIYYDPSWEWKDDGEQNIDLESVAAHEFGHGLSQEHFGMVFITKNGMLKFSPFAMMNAVYFRPNRELQRTDLAGHRSIWAQWPNK